MKPRRKQATKLPVLGGASHASQDSSVKIFGLGGSHDSHIEVEWPNRVRNMLHNVVAKSRVTFPEIPCSFDTPDLSFREYHQCVDEALTDAVDHGIISKKEKWKFWISAIIAFLLAR